MSGRIDDREPVTPVPGDLRRDFLVVGIGGSAGAIGSFRDFFRSVPADSGMAYVVILHLSPEHESRLAEVLQATAHIPVHQVQQSVRVEQNQVYVIPPNKSLTIRDGMLMLSEVVTVEERRAPIDIFFRTLADHLESRAVSVVMSGSGSDGSMGIRRIKENNGLVLVQDPSEASFGEMPRSSIATGMADFILPAADIPRRIMAYRDQLEMLERSAERDEDKKGDEDFESALMEIFTLIRVRTGHDFSSYKRATVLRRIDRRIALHDLTTLSSYVRYVREHPDEPHALVRELLISVTNFFRDKEVWERVETSVIPRLLDGKRPDDNVRIWVPGCATGEEAYTIAMLLAERAALPNVQIFATDLDEHAISRARSACYNEADVADISPERLRRFFIRDHDGYRIRRDVREMVLFAHHNLIKDPPFSHLDFISCRNLLIYLNRSAQQRALQILHFALEPNGFLLLGTAESVDASTNLFVVADKEAHVYQSRAGTRVVTPPHSGPGTPRVTLATQGGRNSSATSAERITPIELHHRLLESYAPPSLIVNDEYAIVHLSQNAGRFLQFPAGEASTNLLQVIRPELRIELRSALFQAAQKRGPVTAKGLVVHTGDRVETINVLVRPSLSQGEPVSGYFLILFEDARDGDTPRVREAAAVEPGGPQLEEELIRVKAQMRSTIEQYEVQAEEAKASNEELQAMNEELRSTAEELETSQEELQSVNEELQTVNQELKVKIDEIGHTNDDLRNLMSSTEIGTIFVDRSLRVKLFTPRVRDLFNLIPADVGRPLLDITNKLEINDLAETVELVLARLETVEREVRTRGGSWFLMRILPYRTSDDRIDGVVVTLFDVTERRKVEEALRHSEARLHAVANLVPDLLWSSDSAGRPDWFNDRWLEYTGQTPAEARARGWIDRIHLEDRDAFFEQFRHTIDQGEPLRHEVRLEGAGGAYRWFLLQAMPLHDEQGSVIRWFGAATDVQEQRVARAELEERVKERTRELETLDAKRQQLLDRLLTVAEEERQRIAREVHDDMGQHIAALKIALQGLPAGPETIERMTALVDEIDRSIDRLTVELRPPVLDDLGIQEAIGALSEQFTAASGLPVDVHFEGLERERLPSLLETSLYRILQEALTNVIKHASADGISVIVKRQDQQVQLIVEDDGTGFAEEVGAAGSLRQFGLLSMRERVRLLGGTFNIESVKGRGTTIYVRVPLPPRDGIG